MAFKTLKEIAEAAESAKIPFWQAVLNDDCEENGLDSKKSLQKMKEMFAVMQDTVKKYNPTEVSESGLSGTDGDKFAKYSSSGKSISGSLMSRMIEIALKTAEANACMHRIVACPTAGSCGVLPSVLIPLFERGEASEEECVHALITAAGIGKIIAANASIAGAEGGCQAEIGSASAMAAGALTELRGGSTEQIIASVGFALQNLMGLVCDPVGGLVEIPCVKRNVVGCVNAVSCADMSLAGIKPHIPCDETISAMASVGRLMSQDLRETGRGGLAATQTARSFF